MSASLRPKYDARQATKAAVAKGLIDRKPCEVCGSEHSEQHHKNYADPLDIAWLCKEHHTDIHFPHRVKPIRTVDSLTDKEWAEAHVTEIVTVTKTFCLRCDHSWIPRKKTRPEICPKCKREDWDDGWNGGVKR